MSRAGKVRLVVLTLLIFFAVVADARGSSPCRVAAIDPADDLPCQVQRFARSSPTSIKIAVPDKVDVVEAFHAYGRYFLTGMDSEAGRLGDLRVSDRWNDEGGITLRYRSVGAPTRFTFSYAFLSR